MSDFKKALQIVLAQEGGYSDDARDPGGKTQYGITEAVARANGYDGDMRHLPMSLAEDIYLREYWIPAGCDNYPWPLNLLVFDAAVNQGVEPAKRMLQRALGTVQDGIIGSTTKRLAAQSGPWHWARFLAQRAKRYQGTRNFDRFGDGWLIRTYLIAFAAAQPPT